MSNTPTRKRRSLMSFEGWRDLVSDSMAIDIGSTSVIIAVRGRGVGVGCAVLLPKPEKAAYEDNCENDESVNRIV